jgi:hypothetical protein
MESKMNNQTASIVVQLYSPSTVAGTLSTHIGRVTGHLDPKNFIKLMEGMTIDSNPRKPKQSSVTRDIRDTLQKSPALFHLMTKGILMSASRCDELDRNRFRLNFEQNEYAVPGILDGGHNSLAIATHLLSFIAEDDELKSIKDWESLMPIWHLYSADMLESWGSDTAEAFKFFTPIEIIFPADPDDEDVLRQWGESHRDITHARNNNAQLTDATKHNHQGFYDYLKQIIPEEIAEKIEWKTNDGGTIKAADVVSLSLISLSKLPIEIIGTEISLVKLYSSKQYCVDTFHKILAFDGNGSFSGQTYTLENEHIKSALRLVPNIISAYDFIYQSFPTWYNNAGGSFGKIAGVRLFDQGSRQDKKKYSSKPFKTKYQERDCNYNYADGFMIPIVVGLRELIDFSNDGVFLRCNPEHFLSNKSTEIFGMYSTLVKFSDFNPGKIIKDKGSYDIAAGAIKMALADYNP